MQDVQTAEQYLGTNDFNNYCEAFTELASQGRTGIFPSAIQAWYNYLRNGQAQTASDVSSIPVGSLVYFAGDKSNNGYGHTGIYEGNGKFISATYNGVREADLSQWMKATGQKLLGFVPQGKQQAQQTVQNAQSHGSNVNGLMVNNQYRQLASYRPVFPLTQNAATGGNVPDVSMPTPVNPASQATHVPNVLQQTGGYGSQSGSGTGTTGLQTMPSPPQLPRSTSYQAPAPTPLTQGGYATPVTQSAAQTQMTPAQQAQANSQAAQQQATAENQQVTPISTGLPTPQTYTFGNISVQF